MRNVPNQKATQFLVLKKALGTQERLVWKWRVQGKDGMTGKPTYI
jgi:hypothetical protein